MTIDTKMADQGYQRELTAEELELVSGAGGYVGSYRALGGAIGSYRTLGGGSARTLGGGSARA